jgi:hypothetical protein
VNGSKQYKCTEEPHAQEPLYSSVQMFQRAGCVQHYLRETPIFGAVWMTSYFASQIIAQAHNLKQDIADRNIL